MQQTRTRRYAPGVYGISAVNESGNGCGCGRSGERGGEDVMPRDKCGADREATENCPGMALAMAYVRSQPFENLYSCAEGFRRGTIFADLDLPYGGN